MGLDKYSFDKLFRESYPALCSFAYQYVEDPALSEDLVQEVFVTLWERRGEIDKNLSIRAYLYTAVKNRCLNHMKHQKVRMKFAEVELLTKERHAFFRDSLIEEETHRLVYQAINELPEKCRKIIQMNLEGFKNKEIAEQLNISINTVKTQKVIAYRQLRMKLGPSLCFLPLFLEHIPS